MKNTPLVLCVIILGIAVLQAADPQQPEPVTFVASLKLTKDERTVLERYIGHAVRYADSLSAQKVASRCLESPEMFAWEEFLYLGALLDAYQLTEDTKYLDKFKQAFALFTDVLRKGDDGYLGWYGKPIPPRRVPGRPDLQIDELQMNFRAIAILSRWVELTRSDAEYARANEGSISGYLELMEKQLFPKWDERGFFVDMGSQGAVYRGLDYPLCDSREPGVTLPHEKCAIVVDGLLALYRATGSPQYMRRAVQLGTRFKRSLSLKDGHYEWMSWEPAGSWDVDKSKPDGWRVEWIAPDPLGEWYVAAVSIAVNLYQYGLVFDEEDIARLIATQKTRCWNGDFAAPEYRTVAGIGSAQNKYIKGQFLSFPLALYDPDLSRLAFEGPHQKEILEQSANSWKGAVAISPYIRARYLMRPLVANGRQPYTGYGDTYLDDADDRAFYKSLQFRVTEPGCLTPLKPSQMVSTQSQEPRP